MADARDDGRRRLSGRDSADNSRRAGAPLKYIEMRLSPSLPTQSLPLWRARLGGGAALARRPSRRRRRPLLSAASALSWRTPKCQLQTFGASIAPASPIRAGEVRRPAG
jgi:hypothetical protein